MFRRRIAALSAVALALTLTMTACGRPATGQESAKDDDQELAVPVEVALVSHATVHAAYNGTTTLEAETEAQIVAKTSGIVLEILVEEGDLVEAGQVVAKLDREQLALEVQRVTATLRRLENEFERSEGLFAKKLISSDAHEKARFALDTERANHDLAKLNLSYTHVRTPIGGVISERLVKLGKLVAVHEPLFRVDDFDPLLAVLFVPERELAALRTGQQAQLRLDALGSEPFLGQLARVSPVVDPRTGTSKVTVEIRNPDPRLKPGMFGRVNIIYEVRENAVTIPQDALVLEDNDAYVYRVAESRSERVNVNVGYTTAGRVEILGGLEPGQQVVTSGKGSIGVDTLLEVINHQTQAVNPTASVVKAESTESTPP